MRTKQVSVTMTPEWTAAARGKFLSEPDAGYDHVFASERVDVLKPNGSLLFALLPRALSADAARLAWPALLRAAKHTNNRPGAAGGAMKFNSGVVGFYKGDPTAFTRKDRKGWWDVQPMVRELAAAFRRERPREYAIPKAAADRVPALVIPGTPFSTLTVNRSSSGGGRNARTAVHRDDGNLDNGYGVLTAIRAGSYSGGLLVFPHFRVAVGLNTCDVLIADNREAHGNTAIRSAGEYERVSVVAYFHAGNLPRSANGT